MKAVQIFLDKNLVVSETLPMFAMPNHADIISSALYISDRIKAGFLFDNSTLVVLRGLATFNRRLASLYLYIFNSNFGQKMPNHDKNLTATALVASASTPNTRKRVSSIVGNTQPAKFYYKVTLHLRPEVTITGCSCGRLITDIYLASTEAEAIGLATLEARRAHPFFVVKTDRISVSKTQFQVP